MIAAAMLLAAIGLVDVLRAAFPPRARWVAVVIADLVALAVGFASAAVPEAIVAVVGSMLWALLVRPQGRGRAGFWPVVGVAIATAASLALLPARTDAGWLGSVWHVTSPWGAVSVDQGMLALAVVLFLTESANAVVRVALATEGVRTDREEGAPESAGVQDPADDLDTAQPAPDDDGEAPPPTVAESAPVPVPEPAAAPVALKGGRLIGPIERIIVFSLTLAAAYPLLAAFIAAKGIVRFPEISRDSDRGNRAEYFLIGSLVSWLLGLAGAFAVWWAFVG